MAKRYTIHDDYGPAITVGPTYLNTDFPYTEASLVNEEDDDEELFEPYSTGDAMVDYKETIKETVLIGDLPFPAIIEGVTNQFNDYIGTDDHTNYVEEFYDELYDSWDEANQDDEHRIEKKEALEDYLDEFVDTMQELFNQRLGLSITQLDEEDIDEQTVEYIITVLYEYFILGARKNFQTVISKDIRSKIKTVEKDDRKFYKTINDMMRSYSPLVIAIGPMEFIRLTNNKQVYQLFDTGQVTGNFLRKYSPRLFQYEDYEADIIANIVMQLEVTKELLTKKEVNNHAQQSG